MNKVYRVVWNAARGSFVVGSELMKTHQGKKRGSLKTRVRMAMAVGALGMLVSGGVSYADVTVSDSAFAGTVTKNEIAGGGTRYEISNQQVKDNVALNRFETFNIAEADIANLQMGSVDHSINVVNSKINIDGVVNALKNNQIAGDVYFFSAGGIAVGKSGVMNVGSLTLGTNPAIGAMMYNGLLIGSDFYGKSAADRAAEIQKWDFVDPFSRKGTITVDGTVNAKDAVILASRAGNTEIASTGILRTGASFKDLTAATDTEYRAPFINTAGVESATVATSTTGGIVLSSKSNLVVSGSLSSAGNPMTLLADDTVTVSGAAVSSNGGNMSISGDAVGISGSNLQSGAGTMTLKAEEGMTVSGTYLTAGAGNITISGDDVTVQNSDVTTGGGNISVTGKGTTNINGNMTSGGGNITVSGKNLTLETANVKSGGGKIALSAASDSAHLQADPDNEPKNGAYLVIKNAYIDSGSDTKKSGDIEITSVRTAMGIARVDVDATTITAEGKKGNDAGNVSIHATAATNLWNWDIGDGAYAQIKIGQNKNLSMKNTIIGDNVDIQAATTTKGTLDDSRDSCTKTTAEVDAGIKNTGETSLINTMVGLGETLMAVGVVTVTKSGADIQISNTDMEAVGISAADDDSHGNLKVLTNAKGEIGTKNLLGLGFAINVGMSTVNSHINIDKSTLYAKRDTAIKAEGHNTIAMLLSDPGLFSDKCPFGVDVTFGLLTSNVSATVGKDATITSGRNVNLEAFTERAFSASATSYGNYAFAVGYGQINTKAEASMAGKVYAGGDVSVKAESTLTPLGEGDSVYSPDTISAVAANGDGSFAPITDPIAKKAGEIGSSIWTAIKSFFGYNGGVQQQQAQKVLSDKFGLNGGTALLLSNNTSNATVSGMVRGLSSAKTTDGKYQGSDSVGAKSLTVDAHTLSRTSNISGAYQFEKTKKDEEGQDEEKLQKKTMALGLSYTSQTNHSEAAVTGDVKTTGDVTVSAKTEIPWQTKYTSSTISTHLIQGMMNLLFRENTWFQPLVDSWSQAAGKGEDANVSGSIVWMNYNNSSKAYIGKKDSSAAAPKVEAGGNVNVTGMTDITTVNFSGSIPTLFKYSASCFWKKSDLFNISGLDGSKASEQGLGGSILWLLQENATDAYIDDGAVVTAGKEVKVKADTDSLNIGMVAAGGTSKSVAFDASLGIARIDNTTKARIGNATVTADSLALSSEDWSRHIVMSGGVGVSGASGIGASIAYNGIRRTTEAVLSGNLNIAGDIDAAAKNTGSIIAISVAGAVTYDSANPNAVNAAGGNGFHVPGEEAAEEDDYGSFLRDFFYEGEDDPLAQAENAIEEMAGQDAANQQEVADQKKSWAVSANVSLNSVNDKAKAYVTANADKTAAEITAGALRLTSSNDSQIVAGSGAVSAATAEGQGCAIAGTFMYNAITNANESFVDGANLTLKGTKKKDDKEKEIDESLTITSKNEEKITNVSASGSGASKGTSVAGQVSLNIINTEAKSYLKDATVKADKKTTVDAVDEGTINSYTGAFSVTPEAESTATGASLTVNVISGDVESHAENTSFAGTNSGTASGDVAINAEEKSVISTVTASAAGSGKFAGGFSISGNAIYNTVKAYATGSKAIDTGMLTISAGNHSTATVGVGALGVAKDSAVGASLAVMVNHSTLMAYAEGDATKTNTWKTKGLSITADNAYNGSASDSTDDSRAKVVAVGAAGSKTLFAGSGSITVNHIEQTADAYLGKGDYDIQDGDVTIEAKNRAYLFGLAGGLSVSAGNGVGVAVDVQKYIGHTYAGIKSGAALHNTGDVTVNAESLEKLMSVAAAAGLGLSNGGAGAAGAHDITTDTKSFIGEDEKDADDTVLDKTGAVSVTAKDTTTLSTGSGAAGASTGTVGAGLSAAVEVVDKTAQAFIGNNTTITGKTDKNPALTVRAENTGDSITAAAGLGVSTGMYGIAGAASLTFADMTTKAYVGDNVMVKAVGDATIAAVSSFTQGAGAGGLGGGANVGLGLTNSTVKLTSDTQAYIGNHASLSGQNIFVTANHTSDITYATIAGGIGGILGVAGTAGANIMDTKTKAYTKADVDLSASEAGITISAQDDTTVNGGNGGAAIGVSAGAGAAMGITKIIKDTEAYVGSGTSLTTANAKGGNISVVAKNTEDILNVTVQGSGGLTAGLAGALNVTYLNAVTKAFTQSNVKMNTEKDKGNGITLDATHTITGWDSGVFGGSGSAGLSVGAAIDVGVIRTQTNAYLGAANEVYAGGALSVTANDHLDEVSSYPIALAVGSVGVNGSISVYNFGNTLSASDRELISAKTSEDGSTQTMEEWLDVEMNKSDVEKAFSAYNHSALTNIQTKTKEKISSAAPEMAGEKGTLASIGIGSQVEAGSVTVKADENISMKNRMGSGSAALYGSVGAAVSVVNTDTTTKASVGESAYVSSDGDVSITSNAKHEMASVVAGASLALGAAGMGTIESWNDTSRVVTDIGTLSKIYGRTGENITIGSTNTHVFDSTLAGASVALGGGIYGAVIYGIVSGSAETTLGDGAVIGGIYNEETEKTEKPDIDIYAVGDTKLVALAVGASGGFFSGAGTGVHLSSGITAKVDMGDNVDITGNAINVTAENTPVMDANANGVGLGIAGVGSTAASTTSTDKAQVVIGKDAEIYADDALTVSAKMNKPKESKFLNGRATATAGAGGVISKAAATSTVDMNNVTSVEIGEKGKLIGKKISLLADHKDTVNPDVNSVAAIGVSGTGVDLYATIVSDSHVSIGEMTLLSSYDETTIAATNETVKDNDGKINGNGIGASIAGGTGIDVVTTIMHNTAVSVGDDSIIVARASALTDEEKEAGLSEYDKNAIAIDAKSRIVSKEKSRVAGIGGGVIATIDSKSTTTANTSVDVGQGVSLLAGDTSSASAVKKDMNYAGTDAKTYDGSYRGGSIGIGTRNDAEISSETIVDVISGASYAGSINDVIYNSNQTTNFAGDATTAKGDISVASGRDSDGNTGTVDVKAHSDILSYSLIPITNRRDPLAKVSADATLTVAEGAQLLSDRDVYLRANNGDINLKASGETLSWTSNLRNAFADGYDVGEEVKNAKADVVMNGHAETGIHRNKNVSISGQVGTNGRWITTVSSDGDISYRYSESKPVDSELFDRYDELKRKLEDYGIAPAAKAAYEAEIEFLEEKMVEAGLGYFQTKEDGTATKQFVRMAYSGTSELEDAKHMVSIDEEQRQTYITQINTELTKVNTQISALKQVQDAKKNYDALVANLSKAERMLESSKRRLALADSALQNAAENAGLSRDQYLMQNPEPDKVASFNERKTEYSAALAAKTKAQTALSEAETAYTDAATAYNNTYKTNISTNAGDASQTQILTEKNLLDSQSESYHTSIIEYLESSEKLQNQISATEAFFAAGGSESSDGIFTDSTGKTGITVNASGAICDEKAEGAYYILHKNIYKQMTHNIEIGDITAVVGDILLEGDNVYGTGQLTAKNDAGVKITNDSPNNLVVGDIKVVSRNGTSGTVQGGGIYYNGVQMNNGSSLTVSEMIQRQNKDASKDVGFTTQTGENDTPTITIQNNFTPKSHVDNNNAPLYMSSATTLSGYIYNPRGSVSVTSEYGDISNTGTIYAGSVDINVKNGDYIQSYDMATSGSITSIGGNPLNADGSQATLTGTGIQANGNIFISARYLNINSTIRSGVAAKDVEIPADYKLYYMNGTEKVYVTSAEEAKGHTIIVADKDGNTIGGISYDADTDRFVVDDVDIRGGHISLVGTILNTTNDTSKAKIEALDGYGNITIKNDSDKGLEIRSLSAGEGKRGKIEITDLDRSTGKILRKTIYTRDKDRIAVVVKQYRDGVATGDSTLNYYDEGKVTYKPTSGSYYNYQIGQDQSTIYTYTLNDTRFDFWGNLDRAPTHEEMLNQGAHEETSREGEPTALQGGAFVGTSNNILNATTEGDYTVTDATFADGDRVQVRYDKTETRLWYTFWLATKYSYKLVEREYSTHITQYSLKADHDIGIGFLGNNDGGNINVIGGNQNVYLNGMINSGAGTVTMSGNNLVQQSEASYTNAGTLSLTATGNAGTADAMIRTDAGNISGTAGKNFGVEVLSGAVNVGNVTAGETAAIKADTGDILQKDGNLVTANRVELTAGGAISGVDADGKSISFKVATGQSEGEAYGLKANAVGDINIENTSGDLYIDSVISQKGNVSLTTNGSFRDNNFTDYTNESAKEKLLHWAESEVLEGKSQTISKQKNLLTARVSQKYSDYQALSAFVKDGVYTLDDETKAKMADSGMTEDEITAYVAEKQARYDELKAAGVDTWTKEGVEAYIQSIEDSEDTTLYGNASLEKSALSADTYLTVDEKADCLVGSAVSTKSLLIRFTSGEIKEGITETNVSLKETPHVSGKKISLHAKGSDDGAAGSGSIGEKKMGMTIDMSDPTKLTAAELLALSTAERGDFKIEGDKVTVTSVRPIDAEATGIITALADKGGLYLAGLNGFKEGSTFFADEEVRIKTSGNLSGITVGSNEQTVLESGKGAISGVTLTGTGVLTARAKNGVDVTKSDGDLIINTVYASEGDVSINLKNKGSLLAVSGNDDEEDGAETGTTFLNVEGENITISGANNIKGQATEGVAENTNSLGLKATGHKNDDGTVTAGKISAETAGNVDVTIFGESASKDTKISGNTTTITNRGTISAGTYSGSESLTVYNTKDATISGGTFTGGSKDATAETGLSVTNKGTVQNATLTAVSGNATVSNTGTIENAKLVADVAKLTITNSETGAMSGGEYKAKGDLTYTAAGNATGTDLTVSSDSGKVTMTSDADLSVKKLSAGGTEASSVESKGNVTVDHATVSGDLTLKAGGTLTAGKAATETEKATGIESFSGSITLTSGSDMTLTTAEAANKITATSKGTLSADSLTTKTDDAILESTGEMTVETVTSGKNISAKSDSDITMTTVTGKDGTLNAGGTLTVTTLNLTGAADLDSVGNMSVGSLTAETADIDSKSDAKVDEATIDGMLTIDADKAINLGTATAKDATLNAGTTLSVTSLTTNGNSKLISKGAMDVATLKAATATLESGGTLGVTTLTTTGDATITSTGDATLGTVSSAKDLTISSDGKLDAESLSAKGTADLDSKGNMSVGSITAETADIDSKSDAKVDNATIDGTLTIDADKNVTLGTATAKDATLNAGGTMNVTNLATTEGDVKLTSGSDATLGIVDSAKEFTIVSNGKLTAGTLSAEGKADLDSVGNMSVGSLTAETADIDSKSDAKVDNATIDGTLTIDADKAINLGTATAKDATLDAGGTMNVTNLATTEGDVKLTSGSDATLGIVDSAKELTIVSNGKLTAGTLSAEGKADLDSVGNMSVGSLTAETADIDSKSDAKVDKATIDGTLTIDADKNVTLGTAKAKDATLNAGGTMNVTNLATTEGDVKLTSGSDATLGIVDSAKELTTVSNGKLTAGTLSAEGKADLDSVGNMSVGSLTAETADIDSKSDAKVDNATIDGTLTIDADKAINLGTATAKDATLSAGGTMNVTNLKTTEGDVKLTSGSDATLGIVDSAKELTITSGGKLDAKTLSAEGTAYLDSKGNMSVGSLTAETADIDSKSDAKVDKATIDGTLTIDADKNVTLGTAKAKDATLNAGGTMNVTNLATTEGDVKLTSGSDATLGIVDSAKELTTVSNGKLTAGTLSAEGKADLGSVGNMSVGSLTAETADIDSKADAKVDNAEITGTLDIKADNAITLGTATANDAKLDAGTTLSVTSLTTTGNSVLTSKGAMDVTTLKAATATVSAGGALGVTTLTTMNDATLTSGSTMNVTNLKTTDGEAKLTSGSDATLGTVDSAKNINVSSNGKLTAGTLKAAENAGLTSKDTMTVLDSEIGNTLSMNSGKDIVINRSNSVTLSANADGSIKTQGANANISAGDITMKAGENIEITSRAPVEKFTGVDTNKPAKTITGSGKAGNIFYGNAKPDVFDVDKKGSATLGTTGGTIRLEGKVVEVDTMKAGNNVEVTTNNLGIDDLQETAGEINVTVKQLEGSQVHYVGIHTISDAPVTVSDSTIEHLNFTGKDDIGIARTTLSGTSMMQTKKVYFGLRENKGNTLGEYFDRLRLKGYNTGTDAAIDAARRSLYGRRYLGHDGDEKAEKEELLKTTNGILFGVVMDREIYRNISRL